MGSPKVSFIVPNWNGDKYLENCLSSILNQTAKIFEVIVVDNGSTDCSVRIVRSRFPSVKLLELNENMGFAAAVNTAIRESRASYVALVNNDVELESIWLEVMLSRIAKYPESAAFTSRVMNYFNRGIIDDAGNEIDRWFIAGKVGHGLVYDASGEYSEERVTFGFSGAACVLERERFEFLGGFNEFFFAYLEDVDLSLKLNYCGLTCIYVPDAVAYHVGSATSGGKFNRFTVYLTSRNQVYLALQHLPGFAGFLQTARSYMGILYRCCSFTIHGFPVTALKGILDGFIARKTSTKWKTNFHLKSTVVNDLSARIQNSERVLQRYRKTLLKVRIQRLLRPGGETNR